jgi:hypothetical protein
MISEKGVVLWAIGVLVVGMSGLALVLSETLWLGCISAGAFAGLLGCAVWACELWKEGRANI